MPIYGARSLARLDTCHEDMQTVFRVVIDYLDHSVLEGHRPEEKQTKAFLTGRSKVQWPNSKHNSVPSMAVDAAPYPIDWDDRERFTCFAGMVTLCAHMLYAQGLIEHLVRWGGDWDRDTEVKDNSFDDLPHFELYKP